ncbi:hypothetical protein G195_011624, partial [Phytophthora kernoviae 00238/432]
MINKTLVLVEVMLDKRVDEVKQQHPILFRKKKPRPAWHRISSRNLQPGTALALDVFQFKFANVYNYLTTL